MRDVGDQFPAQALDFRELRRRVVEGIAELCNFPVALVLKVDVVVAFGKLLGGLVDSDNRTGYPARDENGETERNRQHQQRDEEQLHAQR